MRHLFRLRQHIRTSLVVILGAGLVGAAAGVASSAHAGTALPARTAHAASVASGGSGCVNIENLVERTVNYYYVGSTPNPTPIQQVGDSVIYYDDIYNASGGVIGHAIGYVTAVYEDSPGHLVTEYHEAVELPQGRLTTTGYVDRQDLFTGATLHLQAVGLSGEFANKHGYRNWALKQPIPVPLTDAEPVIVTISLCG